MPVRKQAEEATESERYEYLEGVGAMRYFAPFLGFAPFFRFAPFCCSPPSLPLRFPAKVLACMPCAVKVAWFYICQ